MQGQLENLNNQTARLWQYKNSKSQRIEELENKMKDFDQIHPQPQMVMNQQPMFHGQAQMQFLSSPHYINPLGSPTPNFYRNNFN